jgi:hypothetical protein
LGRYNRCTGTESHENRISRIGGQVRSVHPKLGTVKWMDRYEEFKIRNGKMDGLVRRVHENRKGTIVGQVQKALGTRFGSQEPKYLLC